MQRMKKTKLNKKKLVAPSAPPTANTDCQKFITALEELNQPWNWVVETFIQLLQEPNAEGQWAPQIKSYKYSQTPLKDGRWFLPESMNAQHGPVPLGIVLKNVFEVSVRDSWNHGESIKRRLIPVAMLGPGALFGAFEFCDSRASVPSLRDYEVSAGSRAFKIVPRNGDSIRAPNGTFFGLESNSSEWNDWAAGRADHDALIRYYDIHKQWTATILLLTQTPPNPTGKERDLLDVVQKEAWRQSRHLREGHLKWLRHDLNPLKFSTSRQALDSTKPKKSKKLAIPTKALAAASKFKRKVELALNEECLVFGNPGKPEEFGPFTSLVEKINEGLGIREPLQSTDVLAPLLVHDTCSSSYLSLSDDALAFVKPADYTKIQSATKVIAESFQALGNLSCDVAEATKHSGRADEFWRGAIELKSRFPNLPCLKILSEEADKNVFEGSVIVIAQHLLEETGSLIQSLIEIGGKKLAPRIFVIGKPYSSNFRVWQRIVNMQVNVEELFFEWKRGEFAAAYRDACQRLWEKV